MIEKVCPECGGLYPEWWVPSVHGVRELRGRFWKAHLPGCARGTLAAGWNEAISEAQREIARG